MTLESIHGTAKSVEDTENVTKGYLPTEEGDEKQYRVAYAVHKTAESTTDSVKVGTQKLGEISTEFLGLVFLRSLHAGNYLPLPETLTIPTAAAATTLTVELAYSFLPTAWGKGYATEAVAAVFEACKRTQSFWDPYSKLYARAIVNGRNPNSFRVAEKTGMTKRGIYDWTGQPIFLGGEWVEKDDLHIYGKHLLE